jgi:hypothetical protein
MAPAGRGRFYRPRWKSIREAGLREGLRAGRGEGISTIPRSSLTFSFRCLPTTEGATGSATASGARKNRKRGSIRGKKPMVQRRLRVSKWLGTTPALGVCTLCSREFKVPMNALRTTADAQASLQEQFDRHKCKPEVTSQASAIRDSVRHATDYDEG